MSYDIAKLWNAPLKNGGASNMGVNGSVTNVVYSYEPAANVDTHVESMCLIAEFSGSAAIGNKFLADAVATLTNGLLIEAKADDVAYEFCNAKRTRDLIECSQPQGGLNMITGTLSMIQIFFFIPEGFTLCKTGTFTNPDYIKATVRDDLRGISFLEIFLQGVKL